MPTAKIPPPPAQKRSQRSLDRMLDAAEAILNEKTFDALTVAEVVERAGTSVGVFYSRFANKEALLSALYDRHQRDVAESLDERDAADRGETRPLAEMLRERIERVAGLYREKPGLYRALLIHGYLNPDWRYSDSRERARLSVSRAGDLVEARAGEVRHPQPRAAGAAAYLFALAALREKFLFGDSTAAGVSFDGDAFVDEVCRMACAYLGVASTR